MANLCDGVYTFVAKHLDRRSTAVASIFRVLVIIDENALLTGTPAISGLQGTFITYLRY